MHRSGQNLQQPGPAGLSRCAPSLSASNSAGRDGPKPVMSGTALTTA
jgi:hypothetical protein